MINSEVLHHIRLVFNVQQLFIVKSMPIIIGLPYLIFFGKNSLIFNPCLLTKSTACEQTETRRLTCYVS